MSANLKYISLYLFISQYNIFCYIIMLIHSIVRKRESEWIKTEPNKSTQQNTLVGWLV